MFRSIIWITVRIILHHTGDDRFGFGLSLLERLSLAQTADDIQIVAAARVGRVITGRRPQFDRAVRLQFERGFEALRQNADDGMAAPIEGERLTQNAGIGCEFPLPEAMTEDDHMVLSLGLFFEPERAPARHPRAERSEEIARSCPGRNTLRL